MATKDGHTEATWAKVDSVILLILENDRYMHARRTNELCEVVIKQFDVSKEQAYRYIRLARTEVRKISKEKVKVAYARALRRREYLWQKCKNSDGRLALDILRDTSKLEDQYPDERVKTENININKNVDYDKLTDKALRRLAAGEDVDVVVSDTTSYRRDEDWDE